MLYLKSYCYSTHELPFIIANLLEGYSFIDKLILYEYNYTHTGKKKDYEIEKVIHLIPDYLLTKLYYKKVNLEAYIVEAYNNEDLIHAINEPIQRSWVFNDPEIIFNDDDIIIDIDIDEIIYKKSYDNLLEEFKIRNIPLSIRLNQFFFKNNFLWIDNNFCSPTIYKYSMIKNNNKIINSLKIKNLRDLHNVTEKIYGCHMSWIMPVEFMIKKLHSYSHPKYRKYADANVLRNAIINKKYIFDDSVKFTIQELEFKDERIPIFLQHNDIFDYLN